ncbi:MAG: hypothetical protein WC191_01600 [Proteiniphilum sp.]|jgi:hypothetical protein|nr:hypothetical protein [Synergistaceae bacterium]MDD2726068.1 hypothetical protein [Proteiniphilum sp.]HHT34014.1 hypothetical protein [Bacteroidales bacterium]MDD3331510.1 hypothetical protein [Proteiniphilum sp.]MDD3555332.1 hypothetical protein [Proteiniphilum sp.]
MKQIKIEVQAYSDEILQELFEMDSKQLAEGVKQRIEDTDSEIEMVDYSPAESFGLVEVSTFLITIGSGVAINLISSWLIEKIKKKEKDVVAITINGKSISSRKLTEERLTAVLTAMNQE